MPNITRNIHCTLIENKKTLAVAESCTGGMLSALLTARSGSSEFFILGAVVYSNSAKNRILKIPRALIDKNGAVSRPIALAMAKNVRRIAQADYGVGITGIAGPGGAVAGKPVGTVFIAVSSRRKTICRKFQLRGTRRAIQRRSCQEALKLLLRLIK